MQGCRDEPVQVFQHLDATDLLQRLKGNPQLDAQAFYLKPSGVPASFVLRLANAAAFIHCLKESLSSPDLRP